MSTFSIFQCKCEHSMNQDLQRAGFINCTKITDTLQGSIWSSIYQPTNTKAVIKVTQKHLHSNQIGIGVSNGVQTLHKVHENIRKEEAILRYLTANRRDCPGSIVKHIGFFHGNLNYYLVMEHGGHSCFDFVIKAHNLIRAGTVEISEWHQLVKVVFKQMIESIEYIHANDICHFDISLENYLINDIMITSYTVTNGEYKSKRIKFQRDDIQLKLCDFGLAEAFEAGSKCRSHKLCGKMRYQSPEIKMRHKIFNAKSNDVFCLGVCLFMMITGTHVWKEEQDAYQRFTHMQNGHLLHLLTVAKQAHYVNKELLDLFQWIFQYEDKRITLKQMKQHPWLSNESQFM